jgi:methylase of polypeptide subunit release factors
MSAKFPSIRVEGGLLAPEVLDDIAEGKAPGQAPKDFNLSARHLLDEISSKWSDARDLWQTFSRRLSALPPGDSGVRLTRNQWMAPFLGELGYDLVYQDRAREIDGQTFAISHFAGADSTSPPVHIIGANQSLDLRPDSGRPRLAAHSLVQEYLNRTESLWGLVTNGRTLRLLRDSHLIRRQAFIEFDLETMFNGEHFADFAVLYRLLHRTRLPHPGAPAHSCFLEQWHQLSLQQGGRVREHLRDGVENAVSLLANAILAHPANTAIRQQVDDGRLKADQLYEEFLRFVYRLLFLMVTEERNLLSGDPVYREHYSISRLRRLVECWSAYNQHTDLWRGLFVTFRLFSAPEFASVLGCPPLNGELFEAHRTPTLESAQVANADFLAAFSHLSRYREDRRSQLRRINYSALDVEELGSVYESLLDLQPAFQLENGNWRFAFLRGTERKTTGSYYTPSALVEELIQSALVPVLNDRLRNARSAAEKEAAVLSITVCDPACGSGHFLLAAARRLARELARIRSGEDEPSPREYRLALRDVISHCIYGVDRNPLAVELCKVALWLESHAEGKPLSFLDHRILCGNSLVGVRDLAILKNGVPDDAFKPVTGDDKDVAKEIKKQNRREGAGFQMLDFAPAQDVTDLTVARKELFELPDDTPEQIRKKKAVLDQVRAGRKYAADRLAADLWCAAFFAELTEKNLKDGVIPTTGAVLNALEQRPPYGPTVGLVAEIDYRVRFFHWPLEFPEVFARGGFDVILCNPPWERIKLQQEEFFSTRDLTISRAPNKAAANGSFMTSAYRPGAVARIQLGSARCGLAKPLLARLRTISLDRPR